MNQVIRVLDQIGNDVALLFEKTYLGKVNNNTAGRTDFWDDLCDYAKQLLQIEAIQDFDTSDITVTAGDEKEAVLTTFNVNPTCAMEKLYMYVYVE